MGIPVSSPLENLKITRTADAAADEVVRGDDSRMTNARPASDVYSWAKAATKPSYSYSEVGAAAASHTHAEGDIQVSTNNVILGRVTAGAGGAEEITCTAAGRALLDDADAAAQRTTLGLGDAATKNVGTASGTVCAGNDSRLTDARTPLSHVHGNISNAGAIGSTADLPIKTGASGVLTAGAWGTTAGTFCQGNDSRLSDARAPTAHKSSHATGGSDALTAADIGAVGLASPAFTGTPTAPTAAVGTDTTQLATTAFVKAQIANDRPFEATATNIKMNGTQAVGALGTVARGDHVHPVDTSRAASSHTHGSITNDGKIGITADLPIKTTTGGALAAGAWGTTAGTFCQGNDSRLSDSRPASDVYAWAKASTKPSYAFSEITSKPTTLSGYGITDAATSTHTHTDLTNATSSNTVSTLVKRDSSGNFSAGTITATSFSGNITGGSYAQSTGYSTTWGSTNGTSSGAYNAIMGTSTGATWLLSGTSGGTFKAGIQALDADGGMRFYTSSGHYVQISAGALTASRSIETTSTTPSDIFSVVSHSITTTLTTSAITVMSGSTVLNIAGTYIFSLGPVSNYSVNGANYSETYTGVFSWYPDSTNDTNISTIYATSSGHANNGNVINFRIIRGTAGYCSFQFWNSGVSCNGNYTYNFKFKRIL